MMHFTKKFGHRIYQTQGHLFILYLINIFFFAHDKITSYNEAFGAFKNRPLHSLILSQHNDEPVLV